MVVRTRAVFRDHGMRPKESRKRPGVQEAQPHSQTRARISLLAAMRRQAERGSVRGATRPSIQRYSPSILTNYIKGHRFPLCAKSLTRSSGRRHASLRQVSAVLVLLPQGGSNRRPSPAHVCPWGTQFQVRIKPSRHTFAPALQQAAQDAVFKLKIAKDSSLSGSHPDSPGSARRLPG